MRSMVASCELFQASGMRRAASSSGVSQELAKPPEAWPLQLVHVATATVGRQQNRNRANCASILLGCCRTPVTISTSGLSAVICGLPRRLFDVDLRCKFPSYCRVCVFVHEEESKSFQDCLATALIVQRLTGIQHLHADQRETDTSDTRRSLRHAPVNLFECRDVRSLVDARMVKFAGASFLSTPELG